MQIYIQKYIRFFVWEKFNEEFDKKKCYKGVYACFNAGLSGAFLIPFFIVLIFCGVPLYFLEVSLGQFTGKSPVVVWSICPLLKGIRFYSLSITAIHQNITILYSGFFFNYLFRKHSYPNCNSSATVVQLLCEINSIYILHAINQFYKIRLG